ncbi:cytochrome c biogenesis protein CcsA [Alicyclobacillus shizuokensis]|uniref:cytochrome c biogenesis protein CcsA n=1 Tax=Alicyclobacillus shizuokensis TaxID=392014 RepID=UPI0008371272|nr:cytochrome c biogenesis protein CcsA [Alicyclobacillus shizuokensis]MCL6626386.1 cytochrome c biogenesis protein [Alicyclobacillus shizuokensis]
MSSLRLLFDALTVIYALSLMLFFVDAMRPRRLVNRTALVLLFGVFVLETVLLWQRLSPLKRVPVYSAFDSLLLLSWLILVVALVVDSVFRFDLILFFANAVGFVLVVVDLFVYPRPLPHPTGTGDVLVLHIVLAVASYAAFSFAFVFAVMYLVQEWCLRQRKWNGWYFRLGSLEHLDQLTFIGVLVGFPLLLSAMVLGVVWGELRLGRVPVQDPKIIATIVLWFMYGVYLLLRVRRGWGGRRLAWYTVVCFWGVLANLVIVGSFSWWHRSL